MVYLRRSKAIKLGCMGAQRATSYAPVYVPPDHFVQPGGEGLVVSKRMLSDHLPDVQHKHLNKAIVALKAAAARA